MMNRHNKPIISIILLTVICIASFCFAETTDVVNEESGTAYKTGLDHYKGRRYDEAAAYFMKAYELDNRNVASLFARGLCLNAMKKYKDAGIVLELALEKDPAHEKAMLLYPIVLERAKRFDDAITWYDKGIGFQPDNYNFYWGKGRVYAASEEYGKAIACLDTASTLAPGNTKILLLRSQTLLNLSRDDDAFNAAMAILKLSPDHARARIIAADYKRRAGKLDDALTDYAVAAKNIETKAYAEHYIDVIKQELEEIEIEKEYNAQSNK